MISIQIMLTGFVIFMSNLLMLKTYRAYLKENGRDPDGHDPSTRNVYSIGGLIGMLSASLVIFGALHGIWSL